MNQNHNFLTKLKKQDMPLPKSHIIAESVILAASCKIVNIIFGKEYENEILKTPTSDNTISWHIQDMSQDVGSRETANIKEPNFLPSSWTSQLTLLEKLHS
jgi:hypothetical protein